jgi:hypothetical protein
VSYPPFEEPQFVWFCSLESFNSVFILNNL